MKALKRRAGQLASPSTTSSSRNGAGFTLVEVLVTAAILTLLIGAGIPAFRRFGRVQELELAAEQAKAAILETRAYAQSPRASRPASVKLDGTSCTPAAVATEYAIIFKPTSSEYVVLEDDCVVTAPASLAPSVLIDQAPTTLSFSVSGRGSMTNPATDAVVKLSHRQLGASSTKTITVNHQTGAVFIQ